MAAAGWQQVLRGLPNDLLSPEEKEAAEIAILMLNATPGERLYFVSGEHAAAARRVRLLLSGARGGKERSC